METGTRVYRFAMTVEVDPDHNAYEDPEWVADAAWGTLSNTYGLLSIYHDGEDSIRQWASAHLALRRPEHSPEDS